MLELLKGLLVNGDFKPELVVFSDNIQYREVFDLGIPVHTLVRKYKRDPFMFIRFYRLCKHIQPDLIQSWGAMSNIYAIPATKGLRIKFINSCVADAPSQFDIWNKKHLWTKLSFLFSDLVIGNSQAGLHTYGVSAGKRKRIYNGFDFKRIQGLLPANQVRKKWGVQEGKVIGMVGAFHERKDYETFIRAAILLLEEKETLTFLAIGDGPTREKCQDLIPAIYKNQILLPGQIQDVESLIQIFDIGVLSTNSAVHGEGISNAIVEYMALAKPVVATDGGGTPEILLDEETGFLVPPESPAIMAEKIAYLLDHPAEARQMGKLGFERIKTHFSLEKMTQEYINVYKEYIIS